MHAIFCELVNLGYDYDVRMIFQLTPFRKDTTFNASFEGRTLAHPNLVKIISHY